MEIKRFFGLRNTTSPERFATGECEAATNVDIDDTHKVRTRYGVTRLSATPSHSLWSKGGDSLLVQSSVLKRMTSAGAVTAVATLRSNAPMAYVKAPGAGVFYSNGTDTGRLTPDGAGQWGVTPPVGQPVAAASAGSLPPGRYMYAMTFVRLDGHESGTGLAGQIDLPLGGGISFTSVQTSTNQEVCGRLLYLSSPNGEVLYRAVLVPDNVTTSAVYRSNGLDLTTPLITQFSSPAPAGTILEFYAGSTCVVSGTGVFYSDIYALERFRLDSQFLQFPGQVTMFSALNTGIYVGTTEAVWWLAGDRMDKLQSTKILDYGVIPRTAVTVDAGAFTKTPEGEDEANARPAILWTSPRGACLGAEGGAVLNLTEKRFGFPTAQQGAALVRRTNGFTQYAVVLQGPGATDNIHQ